MYDELNFTSKETLKALNKCIKQPKNLFGDRILKITAKRGIKITTSYKLAAMWINVKLLPERKSYYTYEEVLNCYRYYLSEAVGYFIKHAKQRMDNGTYDRNEFLSQVTEYETFMAYKELAKSIKQYLINRYRSREHRCETEMVFKESAMSMAHAYDDLLTNYLKKTGQS